LPLPRKRGQFQQIDHKTTGKSKAKPSEREGRFHVISVEGGGGNYSGGGGQTGKGRLQTWQRIKKSKILKIGGEGDYGENYLHPQTWDVQGQCGAAHEQKKNKRGGSINESNETGSF